MDPYQRLMAKATGSDEVAMLALVESLMRAERPTLDALTRPEFDAAARDALADAGELHAAGELVPWCDAFQLAIPARFAG